MLPTPHPAFGHPLRICGARGAAHENRELLPFSPPRGEKVPKADEGLFSRLTRQRRKPRITAQRVERRIERQPRHVPVAVALRFFEQSDRSVAVAEDGAQSGALI